MKVYLSLFFVCVWSGLIAQKNSEANKIVELQSRYDRAIEQKDSVALRALFHPDMIITGGDGTRRNVQVEIKDCVDPHYDVVYFKTSNIEVDIFDKTAVLRGDIEWQLKSGERPPLTLNRRITFTYAYLKNQWTIVGQHIGLYKK